MRWVRAITVLAATLFALLLGGGVPAFAGSGTTIGPFQINPVGHAHLCWQATGNGAPILLETCDSALQSQQWSLTPDGVLMNGIGYCLEALPGQPHGTPLYIDFASQCGGARGQVWRYTGAAGRLTSIGVCAAPGGSLSSGTQIVRSSCSRGPRWSIGYSAVTLRPGPGSAPAGGTFTASATVANAASAQTAYGVKVAFGLPRGWSATGLEAARAAWRCDRRTLTCTGTLPAGASARINISGHPPSTAHPGHSFTLTAHATVTGTSQLPGTAHTTVAVKVLIHAPTPAPASASRGDGPSTATDVLASVVALFLIGGGLLVGLTVRRRPTEPTDYQGRRRRAEVRLPVRIRGAHPPSAARQVRPSHADRYAGCDSRCMTRWYALGRIAQR